MHILSHRGLWRDLDERNSVRAFAASFLAGFGTETDVRDLDGRLVISHDMPRHGALSLDAFLTLYAQCCPARDLPLALNVKSDGLGAMLLETMTLHGIKNWFTFDMSVPDLRQQLRLGLPAYSRVSEIEPVVALMDECAGVWADGFSASPPVALVHRLLTEKPVCIVSPDLHGRPHLEYWERLRKSGLADAPTLSLCTDHPEAAQAFFGVNRD